MFRDRTGWRCGFGSGFVDYSGGYDAGCDSNGGWGGDCGGGCQSIECFEGRLLFEEMYPFIANTHKEMPEVSGLCTGKRPDEVPLLTSLQHCTICPTSSFLKKTANARSCETDFEHHSVRVSGKGFTRTGQRYSTAIVELKCNGVHIS